MKRIAFMMFSCDKDDFLKEINQKAQGLLK